MRRVRPVQPSGTAAAAECLRLFDSATAVLLVRGELCVDSAISTSNSSDDESVDTAVNVESDDSSDKSEDAASIEMFFLLDP